ncbi:MAG: ECF transporter S component [Cellulosilyticaceae bacterium]
MQNKSNKLLSTQNMIKMAFLSAIALILMQFLAIKLPMLFPSFLEIDLSETPAILATLMIHPWAGFIVVTLKNVLKALLFGSSTGYVGELANLLISLAYILPLTIIVRKKKDMKNITIGVSLGVVAIAVAGALVNYFITLPMYAQLIMPMDTIVAMGTAIIPAIKDPITLILYSFVPFNILKGTIVAVASIAFIKSIFPMIVRMMSKNTK